MSVENETTSLSPQGGYMTTGLYLSLLGTPVTSHGLEALEEATIDSYDGAGANTFVR